MKNRTKLALLWMAAAAQAAGIGNADAAADIKIVEVRQGELAVGTVGGNLQQVTNDQVAKGLPAWSPDGTRIAFVERTSPDVALARVVVVTSTGQPVTSALVHPQDQDVVDVGMRFVERVAWITNDRVAVSGSLNPSTSEYLVLDVAKGRFIDQFFDDGLGAGFSPNGREVAHVRGSPHFLPPDKQRPALYVNDRKVFPADADYREVLSRPQWSTTGHAFAAVVGGKGSGPDTLVIWRTSGVVSRVPLPALVSIKANVSWDARNDVFVSTDGSQQSAWRVPAVGGDAVRVDPDSVPSVMARDLRKQMEASVTSTTGGHEPDFWCGNCALATAR